MKIIVMLCFIMTMIISGNAFSALTRTGPIDPQHGFPQWYKDSTGLRLDLCLDVDTFCLPLEGVDTTLPVEFPNNFPEEAFWWTAEAELDVTGGGEILLVLALEAAFANEVPEAGSRVSFARVRIRGGDLPNGTYRITHPFGTEVFEVTAPGDRQINVTRDVGLQPEVFTGALNGEIGPFLVWDPAVPPLAPEGFVGDPDVTHSVTGSPTGNNFLRVERIDGPIPEEVAFTDEFSVSGKISVIPETPEVTASPRGGLYRGEQLVTLTTSDPESTIFYTLDGSDPFTSPTRITYSGPISIPVGGTVVIFGAELGELRSVVVQELYVVLPVKL